MSISDVTLTRDACTHVFLQLDAKELLIVASVSKEWEEIASSNFIWSTFSIADNTGDEGALKKRVKNLYVGTFLPLRRKVHGIVCWPDYAMAQGEASKAIVWKMQEQNAKITASYLIWNPKKIGTLMEAWAFFQDLTRLFYESLRFARIGHLSLEEVEELAIRSGSSFKNPYPFFVLEMEWKKRGNREEKRLHAVH